MKLSLVSYLCLLTTSVLALPTSTSNEGPIPALAVAKRASSGSYTVSGLGNRKKAVINAGGNTLDIAIAMLETDDMETYYAYGDNKSNDSANFGIFKQNWGMLRVCASRAGFKGQSQSQWNNGAKLNSDLYADVAARWDCQNYYGYDKWFAGHRNGAAGLANPYTADINNYKTAVQWIQAQIDSNSKYKTDDTRFWVNVPAI